MREVKERETRSITPYEFNNRRHDESQIEKIARSIKEFGFNQPIVVDEGGVILVGHGRLFAAKKLGLSTVPVVELTGLNDEQKRAYRILDNKLQNDSTWDFNNLDLELGWLDDQGFDLQGWGLDALREMLQGEQEEPETSEDGGSLEAREETIIKRGDIIELGAHRVICGDATTESLEEGMWASLLITDPPYGVSYEGKTEEALKLENDDLDEADLRELWAAALERALDQLKEGGAVYVSAPSGPIGLVFEEELRNRGVLRQRLAWIKDAMVLGHSDYHYKHEPVLYGWKPGAAHYFVSDRSKTSALEFARPKASREHPTMKPIELWAELIRNSSRSKERVIDPFLGSGTTLIACDQLDRICYGIEIEPRYCDVIVRRYIADRIRRGKDVTIKINGEIVDKAYFDV